MNQGGHMPERAMGRTDQFDNYNSPSQGGQHYDDDSESPNKFEQTRSTQPIMHQQP